MKSLNCDVCRKPLTTAVDGRGYFHIAHLELCEECHEKLCQDIRPVLRTKEPFSYEWYDRLLTETIEKAAAKGKW